MQNNDDKNPDISSLKNEELIEMIDSKKYYVIVNPIVFNTVPLVTELEQKYFMNDNNEKFILAIKQPTGQEVMPTILTFFNRDSIEFKNITDLASKHKINLLSDNGDLYFIAYDSNKEYSTAFNILREFTNNFYNKFGGKFEG